jgi:hypothetical protein
VDIVKTSPILSPKKYPLLLSRVEVLAEALEGAVSAVDSAEAALLAVELVASSKQLYTTQL